MDSYQKAIHYYTKSLELCDGLSYDDEALICAEMAYVFHWMGNGAKCLYYIDRAKKAAEIAQDPFIMDYVSKIDTIKQ